MAEEQCGEDGGIFVQYVFYLDYSALGENYGCNLTDVLVAGIPDGNGTPDNGTPDNGTPDENDTSDQNGKANKNGESIWNKAPFPQSFEYL